MTFQFAPQTVASHPSLFLGDDAHIEAGIDNTVPDWYPVDVTITAKGDVHIVATLHLSPVAARELRDALTAALVDVESAIIVAAGLAAVPVSAPTLRTFHGNSVTA